jgi:hypothetical protein
MNFMSLCQREDEAGTHLNDACNAYRGFQPTITYPACCRSMWPEHRACLDRRWEHVLVAKMWLCLLRICLPVYNASISLRVTSPPDIGPFIPLLTTPITLPKISTPSHRLDYIQCASRRKSIVKKARLISSHPVCGLPQTFY